MYRFLSRRLGASTLGAAAALLGAAPALPAQPLTDFSLQELLDTPVYSASKLAQSASTAPAAVSIITAADIKAYGYRTLADALSSIRGMFVHSDRNYQYLGTRGFARIGDYNSRVLLLIDGYRTNDNVYDEALIGEEAIIDLDLVDHIEVVQGPGSSSYGSNAFFGVINVVTRKAEDFDGAEAAGAAGSYRTGKGRLSYGKREANGASWLVSASDYGSRGPDNYYPDFDTPATNHGIASGVDYARSGSLYARYEFAGLRVSLADSKRTKGIGFGQYGTVFNDPANDTVDESTYVDASYRSAFAGTGEMKGRLSWGRYEYQAMQLYAGPAVQDASLGLGQWWNGEMDWTLRPSSDHRLVFGLEYQDNVEQRQREYDQLSDTVLFEDQRGSHRTGLFVQDEYRVSERITVHSGLRIDKSDPAAAIASPRLGLVARPDELTTAKLLYGTAFRAPNAYELYYAYPGFNAPNPSLRPERLQKLELVLQRYLRPDTYATVDLYRYRIQDLINAVFDPTSGLTQFQNLDEVRATGIEFELQRAWAEGAHVRASLALQTNRDRAGQMLNNSPRALFKINSVTPRIIGRLRAGLELQAQSSRAMQTGGRLGGSTVMNANLLWDDPRRGLELSLAFYNLANHTLRDPVQFDPSLPDRDSILQDGRTVRFKLVQRF